MNEGLSSPTASRVLLIMQPSEIAYFHAILEGYDDLAVMRTLSAGKGLVEAYVSPGREGDFSNLVRALGEEGLSLRIAEGEKG